MAQVEVSVVVAAHNAADTVGAAIASALVQDVAVEVIVVDDASTDDTSAVVRDVDDPRVIPVTLSQNRGPSGARNAALAVARGDHVAVLDADDTMLPGRLARMLERARETGAAVVIDNLFLQTGEEPPRTGYDPRWMERQGTVDLAAYAARNHMFTERFTLGYGKPLIRRDAIDGTGVRYDERLRIGEDYQLVAELLASGHVVALEPEPGYLYHRRAGSTSARLRVEHVAALLTADEDLLRRHTLDRRTLRALARRRASLHRAAAFIAALDQLKASMPMAALVTLARRPDAAWNFRLPIAARLGRAR